MGRLLNQGMSGAIGQADIAVLRDCLSKIWRFIFASMGRYRSFSNVDKATAPGPIVAFKGDIPRQIGGMRPEQARHHFVTPRPISEQVENLVYMPNGAGFKDGVLYERYSAQRPGLRLLLSGAFAQDIQEVDEGAVIQFAHRDTYGDWVSECLGALARSSAITTPLFLPHSFASKNYVKRDLEKLGIEFVCIDRPVRIKRATVLRQQKHFVHFQPDEVARLRAFVGGKAPSPAPGSLLYLSRHGEVSEVAPRLYPSEEIAALVRARGGRVLRTVETTLEQYQSAAKDAETVIFDHGSAIYNMLYWRPRRLVEIVADAWWNNAFLMFATADGVSDYTIIRGDDGPPARAAAKVGAALDQPIET